MPYSCVVMIIGYFQGLYSLLWGMAAFFLLLIFKAAMAYLGV